MTAEEGQAARLTLTGLITLTNTSGTDYRDARLQLVAGDVNVVKQRMVRAAPMMEMAAASAPAGAGSSAAGWTSGSWSMISRTRLRAPMPRWKH